MRIKCKCGKIAVWEYMPANEIPLEDEFRCEDCVPRGCSCNKEPVDGNYENESPDNWYEQKDGEGRLMPCCEWWYDEDGYNLEDLG